MKKRILASLLSLCLLAGLLPMPALAVDGAAVKGGEWERYPAVGEEFPVSLPEVGGGLVTISGYMDTDDWYVMDGLVLMYDGIYNEGMNQTNTSASTWKELTDSGSDLTISGQTWNSGGGLAVKDTAVEKKTFSQEIQLDTMTLDYAFSAANVGDAKGAGGTYFAPFALLTSVGTIRPDGVILNYNGFQTGNGMNSVLNTGITLEDDTLYHLALTSDGSTTRFAYLNGKAVSRSISLADTYHFSSVSIPVSSVAKPDGTKINLAKTLYGLRLYNRALSADEIAQNRAMDQARYVNKTYCIPGTVKVGEGAETPLTEYDFTARRAQTAISLDDSGALSLKLNREGGYTLSFGTQGGETVTRKITVISQADAQAADAAAALITQMPESGKITIAHRGSVAAAQAAYDALSENAANRVGAALKEKLDACIAQIDAIATGALVLTLTYDANGGTCSAANAQVVYKKNAEPSYTLEVPSRPNYVFTGWYLEERQLTDAEGAALQPWDMLSDATVTARWKHYAESGEALELSTAGDVYALARILETKPKTDADVSDALKQDYRHFGFEEGYASAYEKLQTANYRLTKNIKLTNCDANTDQYNGFHGIPNFKGVFDGGSHEIELAIDFSKYPDVSAPNYIGGVFACVQDAEIRNLTLSGSAAGTFVTDASLADTGLLIGGTIASTNRNTVLENITSNVAVNITLDIPQGKTAYIGAMVGRASSSLESDKCLILRGCVNNGDMSMRVEQASTNPSRLSGLIGHAYSGIRFENCANYGNISAAGEAATVGDLCSGSGGYMENCVSAGSLSREKGTINVFNGMQKDAAAADGNTIRVALTGTAGDRAVVADTGIDVAYSENGTQYLDIPVYYLEDGSKPWAQYHANQYISVNGAKRLYLFDLENRTFSTTLNTADAVVSALPFSSWEEAIPISTADHFLWMQQAVNDGNEEAVQKLYALGGADSVDDLESERTVLRSAYYKLQNNVAIDSSSGFTGIGNKDYTFGGHFDGGGHSISLTVDTTVSDVPENLYIGLFGYMSPLTDGVVEVRNLSVESSFDIKLPKDYTATVYIGGLAGQAVQLTLEKVDVLLKKMTLTKAESDADLTTGGGSVSAGGAFGFENGLVRGAPSTRIDCTMTANWTRGTLNFGGFAGQGYSGGSVAFIGGTGIDAGSVSNAKVAGVMGYSWAPNEFDGYYVKNSTNGTISLKGTNAAGILLGYQTTSSATGVALRAANVEISGPFEVTGGNTGGLFGYVGTSGVVEIANIVLSDAVSLKAAAANKPVGGLIGSMVPAKEDSIRLENVFIGTEIPTTGNNMGMLIGSSSKDAVGTVINCAYVKRSAEKAVGNKSDSVLSGIIAMDVSQLADGMFGDAKALFSGALSGVDAASDIAALDGAAGTVIYTAVGTDAVSLRWNGETFYTSRSITVSPKALAADDITITGVNSAYPSDEAAAEADIQVLHNGSVLAKGSDYTVEQNTADHKFTITFGGNYSGCAETSYTVSSDALEASAEGYTGVYDGEEHSIAVTAPEDAAVTYSDRADGAYADTAITLKDAETKTVYWKAVQGEKEVAGSAVITIAPAELTIAVLDQSVPVGAAVPSLETPAAGTHYTVSGLCGSDELATAPTLSYEGTPDTSSAGSFAIKAGGADAGGNYTIRYMDGTLTVYSGGGSGMPSYAIAAPADVDNGTIVVSPKRAGRGDTVTITVKPDEGCELSRLTVTDSKGNKLKLTDKGNGKFTFTMPGGKVTVAAAFAPKGTPDIPAFADVPAGAYYADAVAWAVAEGITSGTGATTFSPDMVCTRAQMAVFLWRAAGAPSPKGQTMPFTDVPANAYYCDAVLWAVEQGITTGTSASAFEPDAEVTRGQAVTFLYRMAGSPAAADHSFTDVSSADYYDAAVSWAAFEGVTNGTGNHGFSPAADCTRAQIVTLLYRANA